MGDLKFLRNKYGFNQQQIAEWLGVARSHVAHYERYTRDLPQDASMKHIQMLTMMAKMEIAAAKTGKNLKPHPETTPRLNNLKKEIEYQKKVAAYKAVKMKRDLLVIQKRYRQTKDLIELLKMLMKVVTKEKNKGDFAWLQYQYVEAEKKLLKCDEAAQLAMRWRIAGLEAVAIAEV